VESSDLVIGEVGKLVIENQTSPRPGTPSNQKAARGGDSGFKRMRSAALQKHGNLIDKW
jgi:hypothetical protein